MFKVQFWSILLDKYVVSSFDTMAEAMAFASRRNGVILAGC